MEKAWMINKVPISRQLAEHLILPFIAITCVGITGLFSEDDTRAEQSIIYILLFGIPSLLFAFLLIYKNVQFNDREKVREADRLLLLPFSSVACFFIIILSAIPIAGGLGAMMDGQSGGLWMLLIGLGTLIMTAIAHDHPRIWFSETMNVEDIAEQVKNTPRENLTPWQDGIFSYTENGFSATFKNGTEIASWDEVTLITAYKKDLITIDMIVFDVYLGETTFTFNDETPGHMKFMDIAEEKLPGFNKDWFHIVAFPAFETNFTVVFERKDPDNDLTASAT